MSSCPARANAFSTASCTESQIVPDKPWKIAFVAKSSAGIGPLHGCLREKVKGFFRHQVQHAVDIFVVDHADDLKEVLIAASVLLSSWMFRYCHPPTLCPVSHTTFGFSCKTCQRPHQPCQFDHMFETFPYCFGRNVYTYCIQQINGPQYGCGIPELHDATQFTE